MVSKGKKKMASKRTKKNSSALSVTRRKKKGAVDFLPLEGGPGKAIAEGEQPVANTSTVLYIGRIPHGFYEDEMRGFFSQFGTVTRLRIARNKKTGKSKHYGFIEFQNPEVAKIVSEEINNYKVREHLLQVQLIPPERVHKKLWHGANRKFVLQDLTSIQRKIHNKERTIEEHNKLVKRILDKDQKRREKLKAAGIDYECPEFVGNLLPAPTKIRFNQD